MDPVAPPYDPLRWATTPFGERSRMVCRAWALQGYGTPLGVYVLYAVKVLLYVGGWALFCGFTRGMGNLGAISSWWLEPVAFQKAILWSMLFEQLGLGCGSGPLTGRYFPPVGGFLYFLRPGTTKLAVFPRLPLLGGTRRSWLDVGLYAAGIVLVLRALTSAQIDVEILVAIAVLIPLMGLADKTLFLSARAEHYWTTVAVFALASSPAGWIPVVGNLVPSRVPFLLAMRYYAGNWAYSIWLFRGDSHRKLDRLTTTSPWVYDQLERFYDRASAVGVVGKVMGFRLMHLHGRALPLLLPGAVERLEDYEWVDGEIVAGMVLGWNFGDGHLHREQLLGEVQEQCGFEEGELRCIFVESQPLLRSTLHYRIVDAKRGRLAEGYVDARDLMSRQPWPEAAR